MHHLGLKAQPDPHPGQDERAQPSGRHRALPGAGRQHQAHGQRAVLHRVPEHRRQDRGQRQQQRRQQPGHLARPLTDCPVHRQHRDDALRLVDVGVLRRRQPLDVGEPRERCVDGGVARRGDLDLPGVEDEHAGAVARVSGVSASCPRRPRRRSQRRRRRRLVSRSTASPSITAASSSASIDGGSTPGRTRHRPCGDASSNWSSTGVAGVRCAGVRLLGHCASFACRGPGSSRRSGGGLLGGRLLRRGRRGRAFFAAVFLARPSSPQTLRRRARPSWERRRPFTSGRGARPCDAAPRSPRRSRAPANRPRARPRRGPARRGSGGWPCWWRRRSSARLWTWRPTSSAKPLACSESSCSKPPALSEQRLGLGDGTLAVDLGQATGQLDVAAQRVEHHGDLHLVRSAHATERDAGYRPGRGRHRAVPNSARRTLRPSASRRARPLPETAPCRARSPTSTSPSTPTSAPAGLTEITTDGHPQAQVRLTLTSDDLLALVAGELNAAAAFGSGRLGIKASFGDLMLLRSLG